MLFGFNNAYATKNSLPCLKYRTLSLSVICWWRCLSCWCCCCQLHHIDVCTYSMYRNRTHAMLARSLSLSRSPLVIWKALMTATCQCICHSLTVWRKRARDVYAAYTREHDSCEAMCEARMYPFYCVHLYLYVSFLTVSFWMLAYVWWPVWVYLLSITWLTVYMHLHRWFGASERVCVCSVC